MTPCGCNSSWTVFRKLSYVVVLFAIICNRPYYTIILIQPFLPGKWDFDHFVLILYLIYNDSMVGLLFINQSQKLEIHTLILSFPLMYTFILYTLHNFICHLYIQMGNDYEGISLQCYSLIILFDFINWNQAIQVLLKCFTYL